MQLWSLKLKCTWSPVRDINSNKRLKIVDCFLVEKNARCRYSRKRFIAAASDRVDVGSDGRRWRAATRRDFGVTFRDATRCRRRRFQCILIIRGPPHPGWSSASRDHGHSSNWGISKSATQQTENPVVALLAGKSCQREPPARLRVAFPVDAPAKSALLHIIPPVLHW